MKAAAASLRDAAEAPVAISSGDNSPLPIHMHMLKASLSLKRDLGSQVYACPKCICTTHSKLLWTRDHAVAERACGPPGSPRSVDACACCAVSKKVTADAYSQSKPPLRIWGTHLVRQHQRRVLEQLTLPARRDHRQSRLEMHPLFAQAQCQCRDVTVTAMTVTHDCHCAVVG